MTENDRLDETLRALHGVLERLAVANEAREVDPRKHFYDMFNREADEYDRDFHKKYHDDLNTTLVFAGLFSAAASAFIIDIQQELRPDYAEMSFTVLKMVLNATSGIPNQMGVPVPAAPSASAVQVQSILFASLSSSFLAALLAILGKQSLNLHVEGSITDRSRDRELRMRGMIAWRFKIIMECLPFIMQISLLLLAYALAQYMWGLSRTVSSVITAFTTFGVLLYLFLVVAATAWKTCPFQTPVSVILRHFITLAKKRQYPRLRKIRDQLPSVLQLRKLNESYTVAPHPRTFDEELASAPQTPFGAVALAVSVAGSGDEESTQASDTNCISTMFRFANASDAIVALTGFIPEVNWTLNVSKVPVLEVYDCLRKSFEFLEDGKALIRPGMRAQAHGSARALLYLRVQRQCADAINDTHRIVAPKISSLLRLRSGAQDQDHELESTLEVLDVAFNGDRGIQWQRFLFSEAHYCLLSHVLRCRAWDTLRTEEMPTKDVMGFVQDSFSKDPLPPPRVIADCLLIVNMIVGNRPELDERMLLKDKSHEIEQTLRRIYRGLKLRVSRGSSTSRRELAITVLELMLHLKHEKQCIESYDLFLAIMKDVDSDGQLWVPAELSLVGAFKWDVDPRPRVGDPESLIRFLKHCLLEQSRGIVMDIPIERVMLALAGAPTDETRDGIAKVDFAHPLFFDGICHALRGDASGLLRRATLTFLRHLDAQFFDTATTFNDSQVDAFISRWSHSAHQSLSVEHGRLLDEAVFGTLMGLLDSPLWREHIPRDQWSMLTLLGGFAEECIPSSFYRCAKNKTIIPYLERVGTRDPSILAQWVAILWAKYPDLSEEVKSQLAEATKGITKGPSTYLLPTYLSIVEDQIKRIEKAIHPRISRSFGGDVERLEKRCDSLRKARGALKGIQKIPI